MRYQIRTLLFILLLFTLNEALAQQCLGTLGDPIQSAGTTFGSGASAVGPQLNTTTYTFVTAPNGQRPNDGEYTITKTTAGLNGGWFQNITNHTPNDPNGYMMVVNASNLPDVFYSASITTLCPNTTYEFSAYVINILQSRTGVEPEITFRIENNATLIKEFSTGKIAAGSPTDWIKYGTTFTTPNDVGTITLKISNGVLNNNNQAGNDLALDDITFRACGPIITPSINNGSANISVCEGTTRSFNLSANVSAGYADPVFQWQVNTGTTWTDIPGENSTLTTVNLTNAIKGTYQYRLVAAEKQNIGLVNCRVASTPLVITVNAKPNTVASSNGPVCVGANIQLSATEGDTFSWTGPNFTSTDKSPLINNAQLNMSGVYTVTATLNGCTTTASTNVLVLEPVNASTSFNSVPICEGASMPLFASGGTVYTWFPTEGLSKADIANPVATPKETTIYTVTVSNGACSATATSEVIVIKNAVADAGADTKILNGQSTTLNGKVTGDNVTYSWTPIDYLDDATKLNPIATPPSDITYRLTAISNSGCLSSTDEVFIKVHPKIVIPNSFTPNGDGVNDTWIIPVADAFPNAKVRIVNRTGSLLYQSNGVYKPWDGKFEGKDLPVGTYYYTIYFNEDFQVFSGWIFLTR